MTAENLADYTTLRVGGPATRLVQAQTRDELLQATLDAWRTEEPWLVLGGGSNVVISDEGFDGTVVRVETRGIERMPESGRDGTVRLRVAAGEWWDTLV